MKARGARGRKVTVMAESAAHRDARRTAPRRSTAPPACRASLWASEQRVSRASSQQSSESAEQASGGWGGGPRAETRHTRGRAGWGGVPHSEAVYAAGLALLAGCLRELRTLQASRGRFARGEVPRGPRGQRGVALMLGRCRLDGHSHGGRGATHGRAQQPVNRCPSIAAHKQTATPRFAQQATIFFEASMDTNTAQRKHRRAWPARMERRDTRGRGGEH